MCWQYFHALKWNSIERFHQREVSFELISEGSLVAFHMSTTATLRPLVLLYIRSYRCLNPFYGSPHIALPFMAPIICGPLVRNRLYVAFFVSRVLKWPLDFWKTCAPLIIFIHHFCYSVAWLLVFRLNLIIISRTKYVLGVFFQVLTSDEICLWWSCRNT